MKKMLRLLCCCVFSVFIVSFNNIVSAQDTIRKQKFYPAKIIRNAPEDIANAYLSLTPLYLDANNLNPSLSYGAEATYLYKNRIGLSANYQRAYIDRIQEYENPSEAPGLVAIGTSPKRSIDLAATLYISQSKESQKEDVFLSRDRLGGDFLDFSLQVAGQRLRLTGIRGGFIAYKTYIRDNESNIEFSGYRVDDPAKRIIQFKGANSTMMESNTLYLGVSRLDISDLLVEIEGHGMRGFKRRTELYLDAMYAPEIVYYNMNARGTENSNSFQEYNVNTNTPRSRYGGRLGFTRWNVNPVGISYGLEVGVRPGPPAGLVYNTYINLKFSLNFAAKI